jgi:hypothetical protein
MNSFSLPANRSFMQKRGSKTNLHVALYAVKPAKHKGIPEVLPEAELKENYLMLLVPAVA